MNNNFSNLIETFAVILSDFNNGNWNKSLGAIPNNWDNMTNREKTEFMMKIIRKMNTLCDDLFNTLYSYSIWKYCRHLSIEEWIRKNLVEPVFYENEMSLPPSKNILNRLKGLIKIKKK